MPLALFRNRVVAVAVGVGFLAGIAMFAAITFVPLLAQGVLGATATRGRLVPHAADAVVGASCPSSAGDC